ncbi:glycosyltransferase, partial [Patescibacteria group bacterium]|nr:glycosyltransferase [Patescibacteria group bacterium]
INKIKRITEIIVINDASENEDELIKFINEFPNRFKTTVITLKRNQGRAIARNLGLLHANNEILIFLDADMVVGQNFIRNHLTRHNVLERVAIIGLRENIKPSAISEEEIKKGRICPVYEKDFRWEKYVPYNWRWVYTNSGINNFNKTHHLLMESNYLKKYNKINKIGVWELANTFLTSNASIARISAIRVGGFDSLFRGWGFEDVHFGYKIFLSGHYIIPCFNITAFHLEEFKSHSLAQFQKNYKLFKKIKKRKIKYWGEQAWKKQLKNKFQHLFSVSSFSHK